MILRIQCEDTQINCSSGQEISFDFNIQKNKDIDKYISNEIIPEIEKIDALKCILIEVSLSENLLDFYGLRLIAHIRLSMNSKYKRFIPVLIVSDYDGCQINKQDNSGLANIIFMKQVFMTKNNENDITSSLEKIIDKPKDIDYLVQEKIFLEKIRIATPENKHSIANQWAIYQWSYQLGISTATTNLNHDKIASMLYFKYLMSLHTIDTITLPYVMKPLSNSGNILYIDDEWDNGWSDILQELFSKSEKVEFSSFEYDYQDNNKFTLLSAIKSEIINRDPDVILLDLRLVKTDHNDCNDLDLLTGIKVVKMVKRINPGIQIIMLTATSQSIILEKLYDYGILGYIKKEHPADHTTSTAENINKLVSLVDNGLKRSYLKRIWSIQNKLIELDMIINAEKERENLNSNIKKKTISLYELQENKLSEEWEKHLELKSTIDKVYKILDSDMQDKEVFSALIVFKCLEMVIDYCTYEETTYDNNMYTTKVYWKDTRKILEIKNISAENKIKEIMKKRLDLNDSKLLAEVKKIACFRNYNSHSGEIKKRCEKVLIKKPEPEQIIEWFKLLCNIVEKIDQLKKPKVVKKLKPSRLVPNEQRNKNVK